jgi:hypothetical protein
LLQTEQPRADSTRNKLALDSPPSPAWPLRFALFEPQLGPIPVEVEIQDGAEMAHCLGDPRGNWPALPGSVRRGCQPISEHISPFVHCNETIYTQLCVG